VPRGGIRIHPAALEEAEAAMALLNELDRAMEQISEHPKQYQPYEFGTRRAILQRFPYFISFQEGTEGVQIIAVVHGRRRPGYWRHRI
jgi:toxin ParE1/3/4